MGRGYVYGACGLARSVNYQSVQSIVNYSTKRREELARTSSGEVRTMSDKVEHTTEARTTSIDKTAMKKAMAELLQEIPGFKALLEPSYRAEDGSTMESGSCAGGSGSTAGAPSVSGEAGPSDGGGWPVRWRRQEQ